MRVMVVNLVIEQRIDRATVAATVVAMAIMWGCAVCVRVRAREREGFGEVGLVCLPTGQVVPGLIISGLFGPEYTVQLNSITLRLCLLLTKL